MLSKYIHFPIIVNHRTGKIRHPRDGISWLTRRTFEISDIKVISGDEKGYPEFDAYWIATMNNGDTFESLWSNRNRLQEFLFEHFCVHGVIIDWYGELIYPEFDIDK
jgi:hypothetical protein